MEQFREVLGTLEAMEGSRDMGMGQTWVPLEMDHACECMLMHVDGIGYVMLYIYIHIAIY